MPESGSRPGAAVDCHVLVIGGGMAAAWASIAAAREGASVLMVDKGYVGTSGVTATAGPGHWYVPPDPEARAAAVRQRMEIACGLGEPRWMERVLDETWRQLPGLADHYDFSRNDQGVILYGAVRGPEYMRALRRRAEDLGVRIWDQSPALELLQHADGSVAGARGIHRQARSDWTVRCASVVIATGGCAFQSRLLGSQTNTGDGYLMAVEAGAELSGMEFTSQYIVAPAYSTMARGMSYAYASYYDVDGKPLDVPALGDGYRALARHLLRGPVYCDLGRMPLDIRARLPTISPNVMLPFVRRGIDPFTDRFPVTLLAEGTIRGIGGIRVADEDCQTRVPGLYAAGDAASRELAAGAVSGGGSVNSAWALSSGVWSGAAAARRARQRTPATGSLRPLGRPGLRPESAPRRIDPREIIHAARSEATALDKNLFRSGDKLVKSLAVLDRLWDEVSDHLYGPGVESVRAREAAAIVATARWSYTAALHRDESRGMHQREDRPASLPQFARRQTLRGLNMICSDFAPSAKARGVAA